MRARALTFATVLSGRVWIGNRFIKHLEIVTTNNYYTLADLHNLRSLYTNLFSLSPLVFTDL
jgi:hypothetical protein